MTVERAGPPRLWTRRRMIVGGLGGLGGVAAAALAGFELVDHGVLPGRQTLDELDGACDVPAAPLSFAPPGPSRSGRFHSRARGRSVGYTIAYPPGHRPGDALPLGIVLHGFGGDHASGLGGVDLASALAARNRDGGLPPIALAAADGGGGYWNPHPGDDPLAMVTDELIPMCRRMGLGRPPHRIGTIGISMGGYGALLIAEREPRLVAAAAAISPAIWTSYAQARAANPGAFSSADAFAAGNVIAHAGALSGRPVRVTGGADDPFHPGVLAFARAAPRTVMFALGPGCHDGEFFASQQHPSLAFLATHLT